MSTSAANPLQPCKIDPKRWRGPLDAEGEALIDSVLRFERRVAPCVVLTEIDFEAPDDAARAPDFLRLQR